MRLVIDTEARTVTARTATGRILESSKMVINVIRQSKIPLLLEGLHE
jgi:hypothetical protein